MRVKVGIWQTFIGVERVNPSDPNCYGKHGRKSWADFHTATNTVYNFSSISSLFGLSEQTEKNLDEDPSTNDELI